MADDEGIPSLSSGGVGSRFVTEKEITTARERRDEEWKAAYARLGQEPPPKPVEEVYDGRSLAEKLAANKLAKQEEWEERNKLSNQFRALEEDEVNFLDSMITRMREEEHQRKLEEGENLSEFRREVARRQKAEQPPESMPKAESNGNSHRPQVVKKRLGLKGVQIKRKQIKGTEPGTGPLEKPAKRQRLEGDNP